LKLEMGDSCRERNWEGDAAIIAFEARSLKARLSPVSGFPVRVKGTPRPPRRREPLIPSARARFVFLGHISWGALGRRAVHGISPSLARVGPTTPKHRARDFRASVDVTDARRPTSATRQNIGGDRTRGWDRKRTRTNGQR
jgi:hypothetical protein